MIIDSKLILHQYSLVLSTHIGYSYPLDIYIHIYIYIYIYIYIERERDRQTDRQWDRERKRDMRYGFFKINCRRLITSHENETELYQGK